MKNLGTWRALIIAYVSCHDFCAMMPSARGRISNFNTKTSPDPKPPKTPSWIIVTQSVKTFLADLFNSVKQIVSRNYSCTQKCFEISVVLFDIGVVLADLYYYELLPMIANKL